MQLSSQQAQLQQAQLELQVATTGQTHGTPIPPVREQIFYEVLRNKIEAAPDRIVEAHGK